MKAEKKPDEIKKESYSNNKTSDKTPIQSVGTGSLDDPSEQDNLRTMINQEIDDSVKGVFDEQLTQLFDQWSTKRDQEREKRRK